jgi:hypothetical protein
MKVEASDKKIKAQAAAAAAAAALLAGWLSHFFFLFAPRLFLFLRLAGKAGALAH